MAEVRWTLQALDDLEAICLFIGSYPGDSALTRQCWKGNTMSKIDELKAEIERLPGEEFAELYRWLSEKDWERWDKQIEADSQAGRLDFLVREGREQSSCPRRGG